MDQVKLKISISLIIFVAAVSTFISISSINQQTGIISNAFFKSQQLPDTSTLVRKPFPPERQMETIQITEIGFITKDSIYNQPIPERGYSSPGSGESSLSNSALPVSSEDQNQFFIDEGNLVPERKCVTRPSCLDTPPYCAMPEPAEGWCRFDDIDTTVYSYILTTSDGRRYPLIYPLSNCKETNCPLSKPMNQNQNYLDKYVGKTVLAQGTINQFKQTTCTLSNPPKCYPADPISWWPLPSGLDFEVEQLYPVEIQSKQEYSGKIISQQEVFPGHQVYQLITSDNPEGIFIRNSYEDLSIWKEWSGFAEIYQVVDKDLLLLNAVSPPVSVEPIPTTIPLMKVEGIVQTGSQVQRLYCARGLYITADESNNRMGESQPLLLQKASGMFTDSSYIGKKVVVTGTTPGEVLCDALTCGCERYLLIKDIIITR